MGRRGETSRPPPLVGCQRGERQKGDDRQFDGQNTFAAATEEIDQYVVLPPSALEDTSEPEGIRTACDAENGGCDEQGDVERVGQG